MSDRGHEMTDEALEAVERRIAAEYRQAEKEVEAKATAYFKQFEEGKAAQQEKLDAGEITQKEFSDWCYRHMMVGKRWEAMRDTLAQDLHKANEMAMRITGAAMPDVFALNANWATYNIEHSANIDTGFTLYNHETAEMLLGDERSLLPPPRKGGETWTKLQENPDLVWNQRHIQSALLQGVLQGESPFAIAKRLQAVTDMDHNAAIRNARTMTTAAQNAGRESAYERAKDKGVELVIQWEATLDNVTRISHRYLHGETRPDEPDATFANGCRYPGDPEGPASEVYNCRCTTVSWVKGFEEDVVTHSDAMGDMTFEEWQQLKAPEQTTEEPPKAEPQEMTLESITTHEELANYLSTKYNISVSDDFDTLELDRVKTQVEQMETMMERYPFLADEIEQFAVGNFGVMSFGGQKMSFSPKYFEPNGADLKQTHEKNYASRWWSAKGEGASMLHELGHAVEAWIGRQVYSGTERVLAWNNGWEARQIVKTALQNVKKTPFGKGKKVQDLLDDMSRYGGSDPTRCEALAEAFANVYDPETPTHPLAAEIVRLTEERITHLQDARPVS